MILLQTKQKTSILQIGHLFLLQKLLRTKMKQDFKKSLRKEREKKSAVKSELHKFHAERLLNIHITYIFSAIENSNFEKGQDRFFVFGKKKKEREKCTFFYQYESFCQLLGSSSSAKMNWLRQKHCATQQLKRKMG